MEKKKPIPIVALRQLSVANPIGQYGPGFLFEFRDGKKILIPIEAVDLPQWEAALKMIADAHRAKPPKH